MYYNSYKVTFLAEGIPMKSYIEHAENMELARAFAYRHPYMNCENYVTEIRVVRIKKGDCNA